MKRFANVLLIVDERTDYLAALERGVTLARNNQAKLTVCAIVSAVPGEMQMGILAVSPQEVLDIAVAEKRDWLEDRINSVEADGVSLDSKILTGKPFIEIIRQVLRNDHDLIIKCADISRGLGEIVFSSTDMHLMRKCPCPVWIIKPSSQSNYERILAAVDPDSPDLALVRVVDLLVGRPVDAVGRKRNRVRVAAAFILQLQ